MLATRSICLDVNHLHVLNLRRKLAALSWTKEPVVIKSDTVKKIESHWHDRIVQTGSKNENEKPKKYVLAMFPYPSGNLHMGHVRVYTLADYMARYYALRGFEVFQPFGWDGFGLPAENAARDRSEKPDVWTNKNIETMKKQIKNLSCRINWDKEIFTCRPEYYKWTQWIFIQLYKAGLVYRKNSCVNWDPVDKTVLASEQIDENGRSWRSGAVAEQRVLKQWFIKTTKFAKDLYDACIESNQWKAIALVQKEWLGDCSYYKLHLTMLHPECDRPLDDWLDVCCKSPIDLADAKFVCVSESHMLCRLYPNKTACGIFQALDITVQNPITEAPMPVLLIDTDKYPTLYDRNQTCRLGVPTRNEIDASIFQQAFQDQQIPTPTTLTEREVLKIIDAQQKGGYMSSCKLNDWVVSRQRFWGTPIPMIHCPKCGVVSVPEQDLPVVLPSTDDLVSGQQESSSTSSSEPRSPLASFANWCRCTCPQCGREASRETDTLDTFFDSSFYYLRFLDAQNPQQLCQPQLAERWMPVDVYVGGKEHAALHFYYARFMSRFLKSIGVSPVDEPFHALMPQGVVMGETYRLKTTGQYVPVDRVSKTSDGSYADLKTGDEVIVSWEKMSKSKYNGVDPDAMFDQFGSDVTRLLMIGFVCPQAERNWSTDTVKGVWRWLNRLAFVINNYVQQRQASETDYSLPSDDDPVENLLKDHYNRCVQKMTFHNETTFLFNTAFTELIALTNALRKLPIETYGKSLQFERCLRALVVMSWPLMPHISAEFWDALQLVRPADIRLKQGENVWDQNWPVADANAKVQVVFGTDIDEPVDSIVVTKSEADQMTIDAAFQLGLEKSLKLRKFQSKNQIVGFDLQKVEHLGLRLLLTVLEEKQVASVAKNGDSKSTKDAVAV